jgi:hypothetical protein
MTRVCPYCGSDLPLPPPPANGAATQACPTCGQESDLPVPPGVPLPQCDGLASLAEQLGRTPPEAAPAPQVPAWEGDGGLLAGFLLTTWQVLFNPTKTFRPPGLPGQRWALGYSLLMGSLCGAAYILWEHVLEPGATSSRMELLLLLLTPLENLVGLYAGASITHLMLLMVGGAKQGFRATFRVLGYGNAAGVWLFIPYLGLPMSLVWSVAVLVSGLAAAHGISRGRAAWAGVIFFLPLCGLALITALGAALVALLIGSQSPWAGLLSL